jgi:cell division protein FtsI/penicillin-binding protein 2
VLRPNDVLHLQSIPSETQKPEVVSFRLAQKEEGYLAKNVWLNGRPQYFYPLQERFLWSYFFTNLLKTRYDDQADMRKVNVALSLDPALMSQVYDRVHAYQSPSTASPKRGFSLVVLDSDGQLKALSDYKTDARLRINPNRMNDYKALFEELYMDESVMNERYLFGNRCLIRMPNGPASTFKPILYGAVTSQYDLGWPNLRFGGIGNYPSKKSGSKGDQEIRHFGGNDMRLTVGANNLGEHDNLFYLSQSTNTYNTMMVYLGSLTPTQLDKVANGLRTVSPSEYLQVGAHPTNPKFNFPLVKYGTNLFRIDKMPAWDEKNSLLSVGLSENFHLPTTSNAEMADLEQRNIASGLPGASFSASKSVFKLWSFPEASHLLMIDRTTGMQNAVPQIAMGAYPISVTPVKMAEMAAQLFSFNPNFQTSVLAQPRQQAKKPFSVGQNWQGENNLLAFYSNNLFKAMHLAVQNGTAQFIKETQNGYYFYAKTGTGSGNRQAGDSRDKNLMLIISKNQLHDTNLTVESIQQNKFYVVYFSFYNDSSEGDWEINAKKVVREIIQLVQASAGFRRMMMTEKAN